VRVIAGTHRGRTIEAPPGKTTRPTADRVRTALFDLLGTTPRDARVLDLFAGTGALGIEALSRGAAFAVFVETDGAALKALRMNLERLGLETRARVVAGSASFRQVDEFGPYDLALLDPPYGTQFAAEILSEAAPRMTAGGVLAVEEDAKTPEASAPAGFALWKTRRYGRTRITLWVKEDA
jgi:16S rRNA (guanine966-N2)-methyltransferase